MKKKIYAVLLVIAPFFTKAQTIDVYHGGLTGVNVYFKNMGVGGSYLLSSYEGVQSVHPEVANKFLPFEPDSWGDNLKGSVTGRFIENRGTAKVLYAIMKGNLSIYGVSGVAFRTEYVTAFSPAYSPIRWLGEGHFFVFRHISPKMLYGVNVNFLAFKYAGFNIGYNNIERFTAGITFKLN